MTNGGGTPKNQASTSKRPESRENVIEMACEAVEAGDNALEDDQASVDTIDGRIFQQAGFLCTHATYLKRAFPLFDPEELDTCMVTVATFSTGQRKFVA